MLAKSNMAAIQLDVNVHLSDIEKEMQSLTLLYYNVYVSVLLSMRL